MTRVMLLSCVEFVVMEFCVEKRYHIKLIWFAQKILSSPIAFNKKYIYIIYLTNPSSY